MTSTIFLLYNNLKKVRCFEEIFLLVDTNMEIILDIRFISFSDINIKFAELERLTWRSYNTIEVLPTIS